MTTLELLSWARKGIRAEKVQFQAAQEEALKGQALELARALQEQMASLSPLWPNSPTEITMLPSSVSRF